MQILILNLKSEFKSCIELQLIFLPSQYKMKDKYFLGDGMDLRMPPPQGNS